MDEANVTGGVERGVVREDWPCVGCGYNLRGQIARSADPSAAWSVVCPECARSAVVREAEGPRRSAALPVALFLVGLWASWHLLSVVYAGEVRTISFLANVGTRLTAGAAFDPSTLALGLLTIGLGPTAAAASFGVLVGLARFATRAQCKQLASAATVVACALGAGQGIGVLTDAHARAGSTSPTSAWGAVAALIGVAVFTFAARIGVRLGRPLTDHVVGMYLGPNWYGPRRTD